MKQSVFYIFLVFLLPSITQASNTCADLNGLYEVQYQPSYCRSEKGTSFFLIEQVGCEQLTFKYYGTPKKGTISAQEGAFFRPVAGLGDHIYSTRLYCQPDVVFNESLRANLLFSSESQKVHPERYVSSQFVANTVFQQFDHHWWYQTSEWIRVLITTTKNVDGSLSVHQKYPDMNGNPTWLDNEKRQYRRIGSIEEFIKLNGRFNYGHVNPSTNRKSFAAVKFEKQPDESFKVYRRADVQSCQITPAGTYEFRSNSLPYKLNQEYWDRDWDIFYRTGSMHLPGSTLAKQELEELLSQLDIKDSVNCLLIGSNSRSGPFLDKYQDDNSNTFYPVQISQCTRGKLQFQTIEGCKASYELE